jgi:hypothetical protein
LDKNNEKRKLVNRAEQSISCLQIDLKAKISRKEFYRAVKNILGQPHQATLIAAKSLSICFDFLNREANFVMKFIPSKSCSPKKSFKHIELKQDANFLVERLRNFLSEVFFRSVIFPEKNS